MATCPCCSNTLLRHVRNHQVAYFCRHCWQDMPAYESLTPEPLLSPISGGLYVHQRHTAFGPPPARLTEVQRTSDRLIEQLKPRSSSPAEPAIVYPLQSRQLLTASER
jgi:hypothetical protein